MNQQQLEDLLREVAPNNDPGRLEFSQDTAAIDMPVPGGLPGETKKQNLPQYTWIDRGTGQTLVVQVRPDGSYAQVSKGRVPANQGQPATTAAQQQTDAGTEKRDTVQVNGKNLVKVTTTRTDEKGSHEETHYEDPETGQTVQPPGAAPAPIAGTLNTTSPQYGVMDPTTGAITWTANPNYQKPSPTAVSAPQSAKWLIYRNADGSTTTEKNPNYQAPSKIERDPTTGRLIEITEDESGKPVVRPVNDQTTIKPAEIPVLQASYGQISASLGKLAQDLNRQVADGTMTTQERDAAFKAAHAQAETQVSELNGILDNSRQAWSQEIAQRRDTFSEASSRRTFAGNIFQNAVSEGGRVAASSGPGHGKAIAAGVQAMLGMGQRYAQGMGGLPDMGEVPMPRALQQARDVGLPGMAAPAAGGAIRPGAPAAGPTAAPNPITGNPAAAATAEADRQQAAASGSVPGLRTLPERPGEDPGIRTLPELPGQDPGMRLLGQPTAPDTMQGLGSSMGGGGVPEGLGLPVSMGGAGAGYDQTQDAMAMIGDGSDEQWAEAVRRAHGGM